MCVFGVDGVYFELLNAPQAINPTTTATTTTITMRMQIFFRDFRWMGSRAQYIEWFQKVHSIFLTKLKHIFSLFFARNGPKTKNRIIWVTEHPLIKFKQPRYANPVNSINCLQNHWWITWYSEALDNCWVADCTLTSAFSTLASILSGDKDFDNDHN